MYGKIFDSMYDGTLYGQWQAIVTMQQFIVLSDINGIVDMTPQAISARTSIPLEIISQGIAILEAPDKHTRTTGSDGKRIELLDDHRPWGWFLVNHEKYRDMRSSADRREYMRLYMAKKRSEKGCVPINEASVLTEKLTEVNSKHLLAKLAKATTTTTKEEYIDRFDLFWTAYPRKVAKPAARKAWKKLADVDQQPAIDALACWPFKPDNEYQPHPATWLNNRRWEDETTPESIDGMDGMV